MDTPDNTIPSERATERPARAASTGARRPRVSIGLPVYNAERFLEETLDSITGQTFGDWELVISDNASTDRTVAICAERAERDPRIRLHRNPTNVGGDANYNRCFALSRGEYFLGIGADDTIHPEYLRRTVAALDADPDAVFCHSRARRMDASGEEGEAYPARSFSATDSASVRLRETILDTSDVFVCLGLLRASALRRTPLLKRHPYSDSFLQAQLALLGRFIEIPDFLFRRRYIPETWSIYDRQPWCEPGSRPPLYFPHWRRIGEYFAAAARAPVTIAERFRCMAVVFRYACKKGQVPRLRRDLRMAARKALLRTRIGQRIRQAVRDPR